MADYDVAIIGAGPGGYPCAIRLGQLGKKVAIIEEAELGGECLNFGCIPSKAIIQLSDLYHRSKDATEKGIFRGNIDAPDMSGIQDFKQGVVSRMTKGVETLLKGYGVTIMRGRATVKGKGKVDVAGKTIECGTVVIATGSKFIELPALKFDHKRILDVRDLLSLRELPKRLLVVGGGFIGLEMGVAMAKLGAKVIVVEMMQQVMPGTDNEILRVVERKLKSLAIEVHTGCVVDNVMAKDGLLVSTVKKEDASTFEVESDLVLVSVGKKSSTEGLGLEKTGVAVDKKGFIITDEQCRTNVDWIYAVGDVTGPPFLAHRATAMGKVAAEAIAGLPSAMEQRALPNAVFTDPEIATVGLTEKEAEAQGIKVITGRFPFAASGRATTLGENEGYVKLVADEDGTVIGGQIVGKDASELISEVALAIEMGATLEDIGLTIHPHPTLPEAVMEAAEAAYKKATHFIVK